ncbi:DUF262 domain-containing protein [Actinokineospora sp. PR83]|uniref:GmrSD restriction endonuclease domain-containing protein n=1 Tax=Actinokineospora sp. PR83 TaxID=2884908 RepID=UPI0027DF0891|nr:DUF262 domain-containing protein [Actinokineospora sp. PR83]MCG8920638.1 DUF262 domain-containing protein [Actinokineospora sp. PR83]
MKASETTLASLLRGEVQFQVPLYQRTYSWTDVQLDKLWQDILEQADLIATGQTDGAAHFVGSVVLAPSPKSEATFPQWLVVDGQQRLTTLTLVLAAIRDHAPAAEPRKRERIDDLYLVNKYQDDRGYFRLLPTQADRTSYEQHIRGIHEHSDPSRIAEAYQFFANKLVEAVATGDRPRDPDHIEQAITSRLTLVSVTADREDNVHRIFESLNNTGLKLSQADLMRNYLFMRLPKTGEEVYRRHWLPLQEKLTVTELEQLMWLELVLAGESKVRQQDMYNAQQKHFSRTSQTEEVFAGYIAELNRKAALFLRVLKPLVHETDPEIAGYLDRLNQWAAETTRPTLLLLLDEHQAGRVTRDELLLSLSYIESFLVRRTLCRIPTNNLNRIFQDLPGQIPADVRMPEGIHRVLSAERRYWPDNETLRYSIRTQPFYQFGRGNQRRMVLRRIEESFQHSEPVDFERAALTIEHVLPQNPSDEWLAQLEEETLDGETVAELHSRIVHTLGNLTLSGDNAKLSNHVFARKQEILAGSHLEMNKRIAATERWGAAEITARANEISDVATSLWPAPLAGVGRVEQGRDWALLHRAVAALPRGSWTSYGDLAALVGSSSIAVGRHVVDNAAKMDKAHRVLRSDGRVADNFRWPTGSDKGDVYALLRDEGIDIPDGGLAPQSQRLTSQDLSDLLGLGETDETTTEDKDSWRDRFRSQVEAVLTDDERSRLDTVLTAWKEMGGRLSYGKGDVVSCFLELPRTDAPVIWAVVVYPNPAGVLLEVVFQHLARRVPFVDPKLRDQLRVRLNALSGVDISEAKLALRPNIKFSAISDEDQVSGLVGVLRWFVDRAVEVNG